ncbi:MAG: hypothetical protein GX949_06040 [Peptococcaceae bacterium]|nr:hypothetical protein [Peptococcaceae bacterium]
MPLAGATMQQQAIELLALEKELLQEILHLTQEQAKLLAAEQAQELLSTLQKRQQCIDAISVIEEQLLQLEPPPVEMSSARQELHVLLKEVQILDERNRQAIAEKCRELKKAITSLHNSRGSYKAYHSPSAQTGGYFIDHKK